MSFIAENDSISWDYITGDIYKGMSIAVERYYYLYDLDCDNPLKIALRDPSSDNWTKWVAFPGLLWKNKTNIYGSSTGYLTSAIDVHRSMLPNEIIIESDYPTYEENYEAAKVIGKIIESKGFIPHYYFSGNKSIHIHCFFNWNCLKNLDSLLKDQLKIIFKASQLRFKRKFIEWLRTKMITCWDTNLKEFDKDLIKSSHLIRCELSKNKKGYKTFLGYTHKDMSFIPCICNEKNRIYPKLGKIKLSSPKEIQSLIENFIEEIQIKSKIEKIQRKNKSLGDWGFGNYEEGLREGVKIILNDDFKKVGDGLKRSFFILINELKKVYGVEKARILANDWNSKMDFPMTDYEIEYRLKTKVYNLSSEYINNFLKELGVETPKKYKGKV